MVIELADGCAICPRGPFCVEPPVIGEPEYGSAPVPRMRYGLCAGTGHRVTVHRCNGHGCIVDDPVDDHVLNLGLYCDRVRCNGGNFPSELIFSGQGFGGRIDANGMQFYHWDNLCWNSSFLKRQMTRLGQTLQGEQA